MNLISEKVYWLKVRSFNGIKDYFQWYQISLSFFTILIFQEKKDFF